MALVIVFNSIVVGLETDFPHLRCWGFVETGLLVVFTVELALRMIILGPKGYFSCSSGDLMWNLLDFVIVVLGILDTIASLVGMQKGKAGGMVTLFRLVRLLRILRIFKIVRFLKQLYLLAYGFAAAALAIFWVTILKTAFLYICAIILVRSLGRAAESELDRSLLLRKFGNIPE